MVGVAEGAQKAHTLNLRSAHLTKHSARLIGERSAKVDDDICLATLIEGVALDRCSIGCGSLGTNIKPIVGRCVVAGLGNLV